MTSFQRAPVISLNPQHTGKSSSVPLDRKIPSHTALNDNNTLENKGKVFDVHSAVVEAQYRGVTLISGSMNKLSHMGLEFDYLNDKYPLFPSRRPQNFLSKYDTIWALRLAGRKNEIGVSNIPVPRALLT